MSSFNGADIFGSGPRVFHAGPAGTQAALTTALGGRDPGYTLLGAQQPVVTVRGRLAAPSVADLDDLLAAIGGQLTDPPTSADLLDDDGHTYSKVAFISFTRLGPVSKGRVASLGYEAVFMALPE